MKYLKFLLIILLILSFTIVSCKKDSTTGPTGSGALVGTWQIVNAAIGYIFTTKSNQVALNVFDVSGQIAVSGSANTTLDFMWMDEDTDPPSFTIFSLDENNVITLFLDGSTGDGTLINGSTGQLFMGAVTYTYNNGTLTITQSTLQDVAGADTVNISGSLTIVTTNIPAYTPTYVPFLTDAIIGDDLGVSTVEFRNDGTATQTFVDEDGTETDNWTYVTDGNQITMSDEFNNTLIWEYSISGNNMTMNSAELTDFCDVNDTQAECYAEFEEWYDLDEGSLTNVTGEAEYLFTKVVSKPGNTIKSEFNVINPQHTISKYVEKIKQLKGIN